MGFPGGSAVTNRAKAGGTGSIPGQGRSPGEGNGHPAWEIPWTEEPGRKESVRWQELDMIQ